MSPKLVESGRHNNIKIIANAEVQAIEGEAGNFTATVLKKPRYVDVDVCTACGTCVDYCPVEIIDTYNEGLAITKTLYTPYAQAVPSAYVIDPDHCLFIQKNECRQCEQACKDLKAIRLNQKPELMELKVGSVILTPGLDEFDARRKSDYGFGTFANVINSTQLERMVCASGPFMGAITRPSDGAHPHRIAFLQCVGSRDLATNSYCSSVCCTYAIKEGIIAKEHDPNVDITIFYMDIRTQGKGFEEFYERAKNQYGIRFIKSRLADLQESIKTQNLLFTYVTDNGSHHTEEFDMVVLAVGLEPPHSARELARATGIKLNSHGFCATHEFSPTLSSRDGIYVAGAFQSPKDIPESVMQASGSVALAAGLLAEARGTLVEKLELPPERDVSNEEPRIGVFVCHCGVNIGGVADVPNIKEYSEGLDNVVYAEESIYACSRDSQEKIKEKIKEHNLNRVVVAACTPRTHEPLFQDTVREAGLNRCLFEMANIRDHCTWVHGKEPEAATLKAKDLVRMGVAKAQRLQPMEEQYIPVTPSALIIGGGLAGMVAALSLADQGFECYLVERDKELGGNLKRIAYTLERNDPRTLLQETVEKVLKHPLVTIYTEAEIRDVAGYIGSFTTTVVAQGKEIPLSHGVIIVATGAQEYQPKEYLYGKNEKVLTQKALEEKLAAGELKPEALSSVVMIQCVGSRNPEHPYCSRICCNVAIKNALKIKDLHPAADIYVLYKDIRSYGFSEDYYRLARQQGVLFIRYDNESPPIVSVADGDLRVVFNDQILGEDILVNPSLLTLSAGIVPGDNDAISKLLKVPLNADGFFQEAHVKLRPVDFAADGIFVCGLAHSPKSIDESITQAQAAAARAAIPLAKGMVMAEPIVSSVEPERCFGCGICEYLCPYGSIKVNETGAGPKAETITASCKGCGICASKCPRRAISMGRFTADQILSQIDAFAANE